MPPSTTTTRTILVGVDGSRTAAPAVARAADSAQRQHAKLRPVAAYPDHPVATARAEALQPLTAAAAHARSVRPDPVIDSTDVAGSPDADRKVLT
jgi:nucleotide-binding universal stress UspA family protein